MSERDLYDAGSAEELRRLLVTRHDLRELPPSVAVELFTAHHPDDTGAMDTALLLCTDWRWRGNSAKVLAGILAVGALGAVEMDELARRLLWPDKVRYLHPTGWLGTTFIEFEFDMTDGRPREPRTRRVRVDPAIPMETPRHIWPPLRRWAAARALVSGLAGPETVIAHARSLPPRDGAAVITGAVDAAGQFPEEQVRAVVNVALGWRHKSARKAALQLLCAWGEIERARAAAAADSDASIRKWGAEFGLETELTLFE